MADIVFSTLDQEAGDSDLILFQKTGACMSALIAAATAFIAGGGGAPSLPAGTVFDTDSNTPEFDTDSNQVTVSTD